MCSTRSPLIELRDVSVRYDNDFILRNVNLTLRKGDFMAISGPNGGGKTTLLRVMLKLLRPTSGSVRYFNDGLPVRNLAIGYLPQKSMIDTRFPVVVKEVLKSGLLGSGFRRDKAAEKSEFDRVVQLTGVGDYLDRPISGLSGGQLQRVLLGRALISRPGLLVLDEPLSYVDKKFEYQIYDMMSDLSREATIVLVSHEMTVISRMADRHITVSRTHS